MGDRDPLLEPGEALAATGVGCFAWDPAAGRIALDSVGRAAFGLLPAEFTGLASDLRPRIHGADWALLSGLSADLLAGRRDAYSAYFRVVLHDGRCRWTHSRGSVVRARPGGAIRVVGVVRDATLDLAHSALRLPGEEAQDPLRALGEGALALARAMSVREVATLLADEVTLRPLGAKAMSLGVLEQGRLQMVRTVLAPDAREFPFKSRLADSWPLNDAVRTSSPLFFTSVHAFLDRYPRLAHHRHGFDATAAAFLPLVDEGQPLGALGVFYDDRSVFSLADHTLMNAWAKAVARAVHRVLPLDRSREIAAGLQNAMLPRRMPATPGGRIAVRYRTARQGVRVGGDWYDAVTLPDGGLGLAIGDVQGHDIEAAALMGQVRVAMTAYAAEGHECDSVLGKASAFLADLDADRFATCQYLRVALATGEVHAANAGHPPPLLRHADGAVEHLRLRGGPPLGLPAGWGLDPYPYTTARLAPGETLLLYSDGLVEKPGEDFDLGLSRLAAAFSDGPPDLEELADHLLDTLTGGPHAEDDAALLMLRRDEAAPAP
ncbi:SpoIIE family protein phosphatase [Streptomyces sp. Je 1-79]|uniref:SpoIIE family protein phosphatase n=1 Tax=Streptomyces sp. Je 1-79 TaxID=2943847 RepID=UPI0021A4E3CD|nr:SpoIIE family protein phosphatase [Streptomyces sp. Je 1-79]MCT4357559.1 SpoIIE family protein phosphatase [Streptomyces sp. Je 1-79]